MMNEERWRLLSPKPTNHHPAPWHIGTVDGGTWPIMDADGRQVAESHRGAVADVIVAAVNFYAGFGGERGSSPVLAWLRGEAAHMGMTFDENDASSIGILTQEISYRLKRSEHD